MLTHSNNYYDLIIVGAGLMGSTLACALANTSYKIAIIDRQLPSFNPENKFELRVNAYNLATESLLREIGAWQCLPPSRIFPFNKVFVCSEGNPAGILFSAADIKQTHIGHFIENNLVNVTLIDCMKKADNIDIITGVEISDIEYQETAVTVITNDEQTFTAKLVVGCDGGNSFVRKKTDIDVIQLPYNQHCMVGTVHFSGDLDATAWQRFLTTGPLGLLPLAKGYCSLAWTYPKDQIPKMKAMTNEEFICVLEQALQGKLGKVLSMNTRADFPLMAKHAMSYTGYRTALVGDAAHVIHPLAGFGANLGFQDVAVLANILMTTKRCDLGNSKLLHSYESARNKERKDNYKKITIILKIIVKSWILTPAIIFAVF